MLPDHLDESLELFDASGRPLGQVRPDDAGGLLWETAPGRAATVGRSPAADVGNEFLRGLVLGLLDWGTADHRRLEDGGGPEPDDALSGLLRAIDSTLWTVDPFGHTGDEHLSMLVGHPIVVMRAVLRLEVDDPVAPPANATTPVVVRLGNLAHWQDGLLGYFAGDDYTTFHAAAAAAGMAREVGPGRGFLQQIQQVPDFAQHFSDDLPDGATTGDTPVTHPYIAPSDVITVRANQDVRLTMLVEPHTVVHATTGLLPRKEIGMRREWMMPALASLAPTFRFGPVLVDPKQIRLPIATDIAGTWTWTHKADVATWVEEQVTNATQDARLSDDPAEGEEGWLRLTPPPPGDAATAALPAPAPPPGPTAMSPQPSSWAPLGAFVVPNGQVGTTSDTLSAPVSGRVTGLWADPSAPDQNLYVATAAGGAWHTADGGVTWTPLLDGEATLATGAITSANGIVYVGTGEANYGGDNVAGLGVVTIDIAANTKTYDYLPQFAGKVISRLAVDDPANPALLYVASSNGLWRKQLSTGTWKELPVTGLPTSQDITDVLVNPAGRLYAGVNGQRRVHVGHPRHARPGGRDVADLPTTSVGRVALTICHNAAQTIYAAIVDPAAPRGVRIFRCDNAPQAVGDSPAASLWTAVTPPKGMEQLWYTNVISVHPRDPDVVYYGETHLWRSKDGGGSWERSTSQHGKAPGAHADQHALVIQDEPLATPKSFNGVKLWAGNDGGVWRSVDGGGTWKPRNRGLNTMQYFAVATHPTERNIVTAGAQDNGTQRYLGDGAWELADYGDGCYVAFDPVDPTIWFNGYLSYGQSGTSTRTSGFSGFQVSARSGQLGSYTAAAGRSGSANAIGATDEALFYAPFLVVPPSGGATAADIWVGTDRLYYSNSRGDRWFAVTASLLTPPLNPNTREPRGERHRRPFGRVRAPVRRNVPGPLLPDRPGWRGLESSGDDDRDDASYTGATVPVLLAAGMAAGSFLSAIAAARLPSGEDRVWWASAATASSGAPARRPRQAATCCQQRQRGELRRGRVARHRRSRSGTPWPPGCAEQRERSGHRPHRPRHRLHRL